MTDRDIMAGVNDLDSEHHQVTQTLLEMTPVTPPPAPQDRVTLVWRDLSCTLKSSTRTLNCLRSSIEADFKNVLAKQSGTLSSGELVGILGPSGAGKSTLLKCLSGRMSKGTSGDVYVRNDSMNSGVPGKPASLAFLGQQDSLLNRLTVRESLTFASRVKHGSTCASHAPGARGSSATGQPSKHHKSVEIIIEQFNLGSCGDVMAIKCSGGQRRRLSIALELINVPSILVLDEPTSGLDSTSALQVVQLMRNLAEGRGPQTSDRQRQLAILVSLHQPSARLLSLFHRVLILSHDGRLLFHDPVKLLEPRLRALGHPCPPLHNIADHAIELASGTVGGQDVIRQLAALADDQAASCPLANVSNTDTSNCSKAMLETNELSTRTSVKTIMTRMQNVQRRHFLSHVYILTLRTLIVTVREPWLCLLRFIGNLVVAMVVASLYNSTVGSANGCVLALDRSTGSLLDFVNSMQSEQVRITDNLSHFFFSLLFLVFASMMTTVMVFPQEMSVLIKERQNGCYSVMAYFLGKNIADLPFTLFNSIVYVAITYHTTGQIQSIDRFLTVLLVCVLMSLIGQSTGLLFGALWVDAPESAMFVAPTSTIPFFLLSGFFVKIETMPPALRPVTYMSYWRWGFEAIIIAIYGKNRCKMLETALEAVGDGNPMNELNECTLFGKVAKLFSENEVKFESVMTYLLIYFGDNQKAMSTIHELERDYKDLQSLASSNSTSSQVLSVALNSTAARELFYQGSYVMKQFQLTDDNLIEDISVLVVFVILFRLIAYVALYVKARQT